MRNLGNLLAYKMCALGLMTLGTQAHSYGTDWHSRPDLPSVSAEVDMAVGEVGRAVLDGYKFWESNTELRFCFLNGEKSKRDFFVTTVSQWDELAPGLSFSFNDPTANFYRECSEDTFSHIHVSFTPGAGHWSYVGNDALRIAPTKPTMNIGMPSGKFAWQAQKNSFGATILHEMGHALAMQHEHQGPKASCEKEIDWPAVYKSLGGPPNNWDRGKVDHNLRPIVVHERTLFTKYDPNSIMHYSFPASWFKAGTTSACFVARNESLSSTDKAIVAKIYPDTRQEQITYLNALFSRTKDRLASQSADAEVTANVEQAISDVLSPGISSDIGVVNLEAISKFNIEEFEGNINQGSIQIESNNGSVVSSGTISGSVVINNTFEPPKPDQPDSSTFTLIPVVDHIDITRRKITHPRVGISTGNLTQTKCRKFSYGPSSDDWSIEVDTVNITNKRTEGSHSERIITKTTRSVVAEFCAKSQISGFDKDTGNAYGSVSYFERSEVPTQKNLSPINVLLTPQQTSATVIVPERSVQIGGVIIDSDGDETAITGTGKFGNYSVTYDRITQRVSISWDP